MRLLAVISLATLVASGLCCSPSTGPDTGTTAAGGGSTSQAASSAGTTTASSAATTTQNSAAAACQAVACDFSSGTCGYQPAGDGGDGACKSTNTRSGNRDTGVPGPDQGASNYVDCRPKPKGGKQALNSGALNNAADINVLVRVFESTNQFNLQACNGDTSTACQDVSRVGVDAGDRQYNSKIIKVPANTKSLTFVCNNQGPNIGDCGIGKVTVVDANGNDQCAGGGGGSGGSSGGGSTTAASGGATTASSGSRRAARKRQQRRKQLQQ